MNTTSTRRLALQDANRKSARYYWPDFLSLRLLLLIGAMMLGSTAMALDPDKPAATDKRAAGDSQFEILPGDMTLAKLFELVRQIDPKAVIKGNSAQFMVRDRNMILVGDEHAGRMRVMSPIARSDALDPALLRRMLQANFDAVLDSRYAIANDIVWSVFIHPLPPMDKAQFANAVSQVYVAADTFGGTYTSGVLVFGGGDTNKEHSKLREELRRRLKPET